MVLPRLIAVSMCLLIVGCDRWDAKAPEETNVGQVTANVVDAFVTTEISVSSSEFEKELLARYSTDPLTNGTTGWVSAKALVEEKSIEQRLVDHVVTPFKAAGCVLKEVAGTCPRQITRNIRERCFRRFRPWDCIRTIVETVYVPCVRQVRECWPEVKAVVVQKLEPFILLKEEVIPTSVRINHEVKLREVDIEAANSELRIAASVRLNLAIDFAQGFLNEKITAKGAVTCHSDFKVTARADAKVVQGPDIDLSITDFGIDAERVCVPGAVELADLALASPGTYLSKELLGPIIKKKLIERLNEKVKESIGEDLKFGSDIAQLAEKTREPLRLGENLWLRINPKQLWISQFRSSGAGESNRLQLGVAIAAAPIVSAGDKPESPPLPNPFPVSIRDEVTGNFYLVAEGMAPLQTLGDELSRLLSRELVEKHPQAPLTIGPIRIYQSGPRFVVALTLVELSDHEKVGTVYLTASPFLEKETRTVRLHDVQFDLDSRRVLLKLADWLLSGVIEKGIEHGARFKYGGLIVDLEKAAGSRKYPEDSSGGQNGEFRHQGKDVTVIGKLHGVDIESIWIADGALHVLGLARGQLNLNYRPRL